MNELTPVSEFNFSLAIDGIADLTDDAANALFEAGCDDATFTSRDGRLFADFTRAAPSLADAIASAIRDVNSAGVGATVAAV